MGKEDLNYEYRPSKNINRKILIEILREIFGAYGCKKHTYIGFGALFFTDFKLIHKQLNIDNMISIEGLSDNEKRYKFNRPFSSIQLEKGMSNDVLPNLDWKGKKVLWLDYTKSLNSDIMEDIETTFLNLNPESFFMLTCNATFPNKLKENVEDFLQTFPAAPQGLTLEKLSSSKLTPDIIRDILKNTINTILNSKNLGRDTQDQLIFKQLIFVRYKDGAPMLSYGGILIKKSDKKHLEIISSMNMPYLRKENKEYLNIESPLITSKEMGIMNSILPKRKNTFLNAKKIEFIPIDCKEAYFEFYRYHPSYVEIAD